MKRFAQALVVWSLIWLVLLVVAYLASDGEPICEGPLILSVADSFPPQCEAPRAALPTVGLFLYAVGFFPAMLLAAVLQAPRRSTGGRFLRLVVRNPSVLAQRVQTARNNGADNDQ